MGQPAEVERRARDVELIVAQSRVDRGDTLVRVAVDIAPGRPHVGERIGLRRSERNAGLAADARDVVVTKQRWLRDLAGALLILVHPGPQVEFAVALTWSQPDFGQPLTPSGQTRRVVLRRERMGHGHDVEAVAPRPA